MELGKVHWAETRQRTRAIEPAFTKIREAHPDDEQAQQRELMALYQKYDINPARGCGLYIAVLLVMTLPVFVPPRHQTLPDLLAGTVVVVDR